MKSKWLSELDKLKEYIEKLEERNEHLIETLKASRSDREQEYRDTLEYFANSFAWWYQIVDDDGSITGSTNYMPANPEHFGGYEFRDDTGEDPWIFARKVLDKWQ